MSGTNSKKQMISEGPIIILVEPQLGENIGMVARAMANFGLDDLRIVAPRDGWPNEKAISAASKADHVLDGAQIFDDLSSAIADLNFVLATTARERDGHKPVQGPVSAAKELRVRFKRGEKLGILFGRERIGLRNDEVSLADELVTFPVNPAFASLNISQAVLLMSYEWLKSGLDSETDIPHQSPDFAPAEKHHLRGLIDQVEEALDSRGYFRSEKKRPALIDNLRAVFSRPAFSENEIFFLRGVFSSLDQYSRSAPKGKSGPGLGGRSTDDGLNDE
jgi:tRNA/rRNA methyltransferase